MINNQITINVDIGKAIEKGLTKKKWSRKALADLMGITPDLVSKWIRNERTPTGHDLIKIACALNIIHDLFPVTEQRKITTLEVLNELKAVKEKIAEIEAKLDI